MDFAIIVTKPLMLSAPNALLKNAPNVIKFYIFFIAWPLINIIF